MIRGNFSAMCGIKELIEHPSLTLEKLGAEIEQQQNVFRSEMIFELDGIGMSHDKSKIHFAFTFQQKV